MDSEPGKTCDIWLWNGAIEYEGSVTKLAEPSFTAHLREAHRSAAASRGRRFNTTFFDLQRQFVGCHFLAYCRLTIDSQLQEVVITSVQRSSSAEYDFLVCGRFQALNDSQKEAYRKMPADGVGKVLGERLGEL